MSPASSDRVRRPAFQLYASDDILANGVVMDMCNEALGVHVRLYCRAWLEEGIPADFDRLARGLKLTRKRFDALWVEIAPAWEERNGRLYCPEQEAKRTAHDAYVAKQRENGAKGGRPRKDATGSDAETQNNPPLSDGLAKKTSPSPSATSTAEQLTPPAPPPGGDTHGDDPGGGPAPPTPTRRGRGRTAAPRPSKRVPPAFQPRPEDWSEAVQMLGVERAKLELAKFRDYEFGRGHTDWDATWRNWYREALTRGGGGGSGGGAADVAAGVNAGTGGSDEWRAQQDAEDAFLKAEERWKTEVGARYDLLPEEKRKGFEAEVFKRKPEWRRLPPMATGPVRNACLRLFGRSINRPPPVKPGVARV